MVEEKTTENHIEQTSKRNESLLRATSNLTEICNLSNDSQNKKYQYLPFWLEKESKLLLRILENFFAHIKEELLLELILE